MDGLDDALDKVRVLDATGSNTAIPASQRNYTPGGAEGKSEEATLKIYAKSIGDKIDELLRPIDASDSGNQDCSTSSLLEKAIDTTNTQLTKRAINGVREKSKPIIDLLLKKITSDNITNSNDDDIWQGHEVKQLPKIENNEVKNRAVRSTIVRKLRGRKKYIHGTGNYNCSSCNANDFELKQYDSRYPPSGNWTKFSCACDNKPRCDSCLRNHLKGLWNKKYTANCNPDNEHKAKICDTKWKKKTVQ